MDYLAHLGLEFFDELLGVVLLMLDVAQLLLPDACELTTLQELLPDQVDEFDARGGGNQALALALDVVALEEGLDDGGA